jgi:hypothetical protein
MRRIGDGDSDELGNTTTSLFKTLTFGEFFKKIIIFQAYMLQVKSWVAFWQFLSIKKTLALTNA